MRFNSTAQLLPRSPAAGPVQSATLRWSSTALLLLGVATLLRFAWFDVPILGLDEQFYVLIGQRMLDGAVPYVDLFDRKPYGLFAIFAMFAAIGGDPLMTAKVAATMAAAATALIIARIAARRVLGWPALFAGVFYLVSLGMAEGQINQSPVFYNLLIALGGSLALRTSPRLDGYGDVIRAGTAMLLCGLAIQIKTTAVMESVAIGLWLVLRIARLDVRSAIRPALLFVAIGLLPTLAVAVGYALIGKADAWWFATMISQSRKTGSMDVESMGRLMPLLIMLAGPMVVAAIGWSRLPRDEYRSLLTAWLVATVTGAFIIGNFHPHYALPALVPAAILSASLFARPRFGIPAFLAVVALPGTIQIIVAHREAAIAKAPFAEVMAALPFDVRTTCMLSYTAPMAYYVASHACLVTPYLFIDQLATSVEQHALPIDASIALREALNRRPGTIITIDHAGYSERNMANDALMAVTLARNYHRIAAIPHGWGKTDPRPLEIWRRRDLVD